MVAFFNRTLEIISNLNEYNFFESNQTEINTVKHTVRRYAAGKMPEKKDINLAEILASECFGTGLKEYLVGVEKLELIFRINNLTLNVRNVDLTLDIEVLKKFQIKVTLKTKCYNMTFIK